MRKYTEEECAVELEKGRNKAEEIINDKSKFDTFLKRLEVKLSRFPHVGNQLADLPVMIALVKDYAKGNYKVAPVKSIIYLVMALLYFIAPLDLVADVFPLIGITDDVSVIMLALKSCYDDVEAYKEWKEDVV
ncbi:MAG: DUF1232 domain-containing protein [Pseudobutyrivibrio sp.]|nr:DUF1232 domain-containing protein [Pseudobutyrivibrio sp.]